MSDHHAIIEWSEVRSPDKDCSYTHVIGQTPFGRILITWKGWKDYFDATVDESPWGFMNTGGSNVEAVQREVEAEYTKRLSEVRYSHADGTAPADPQYPPPPKDGPAPDMRRYFPVGIETCPTCAKPKPRWHCYERREDCPCFPNADGDVDSPKENNNGL
jgi:hypothetical protein